LREPKSRSGVNGGRKKGNLWISSKISSQTGKKFDEFISPIGGRDSALGWEEKESELIPLRRGGPAIGVNVVFKAKRAYLESTNV